MKTLYITVTNDLSGDQRVHRIASTLVEMGFEVHVVGRQLKDSLPLQQTPYQTHRLRLLFTQGKWFYLAYNLRLILFLLFRKVDVINSCDLDTLLAGHILSKVKRKPLVYDSHEYFTEVPELVHRPATQRIWLSLEQWIFPKLQHVYTVNQSIADIYSQQYKVDVRVIRNLPLTKNQSQTTSEEKILIYQGALNLGRGIDLMIDAMEHLEGYKLWIVGRGDVEQELRVQAANKSWATRVIFKGFVPFSELATLTYQASLGLSLEENMGKNYYYASPNKVYDYIQAGIPVIVSDLPEMRRTVEDWGIGEILRVEDRNPWQLSRLVLRLMEEEYSTKKYSLASKKAARILNWEEEQNRLKQIYKPFLKHD